MTSPVAALTSHRDLPRPLAGHQLQAFLATQAQWKRVPQAIAVILRPYSQRFIILWSGVR